MHVEPADRADRSGELGSNGCSALAEGIRSLAWMARNTTLSEAATEPRIRGDDRVRARPAEVQKEQQCKRQGDDARRHHHYDDERLPRRITYADALHQLTLIVDRVPKDELVP